MYFEMLKVLKKTLNKIRILFMELTKPVRKAKILKKEIENKNFQNPTKESKNMKLEANKEMLNFKEIIANQILFEIMQFSNFNEMNDDKKKLLRSKIEFVVSSNFNNIIERFNKKYFV